MAESITVQRAIASVFIRSDPRSIATPELVGVFREHRKAASTNDVIDVLIRRLERTMAVAGAHRRGSDNPSSRGLRPEDHYNGENMAMNTVHADVEPTRAEIDALGGPSVIEFGTSWCGYCRALQPRLAAALADRPRVKHVKVEDGSGRRLGRSFGVKLWPTLIFMRDGKELARLVRPTDSSAIDQALAQIDTV